MFALREMREEHEPLSLEVQLPFKDPLGTALDIKRLAQVFGRGVGITRDKSLALRAKPSGGVHDVFADHDSAPLTSLYNFLPPFSHVDESDLGLVLRRDGHITLAARQNPLLEFYDGGWHTVDLLWGKSTVNFLVDEFFGDGSAAPALADSVLRLAHHLATHWHGSILAVVDEQGLGRILETPSPDSEKVTVAIREALLEIGKGEKISEVPSNGMGRLFLSCAIQDGAILFAPDGKFLSAGRIVSRTPGTPVSGGARRHAAKALSKHGVVLAVSQDGAIRLYSEPRRRAGIAMDGLRIH
jgi:hypothetical protein